MGEITLQSKAYHGTKATVTIKPMWSYRYSEGSDWRLFEWIPILLTNRYMVPQYGAIVVVVDVGFVFSFLSTG